MARKQIIFWLDDSDPLQAGMLDYLGKLKQDRAFAPTMRSALMLIADLREKRVTELEKQFPFVVTHYRDVYRPTPPAAAPPDDDTRKRITALEQLVLQQASPTLHALPAPKASTIQPAAADLIEVKNAKGDRKSGWNTLIGIAALQSDFSILPPDVFEYGQSIGRIPVGTSKPPSKPSHKHSESKPTRKTAPPPALEVRETQGGIKPLAGFVPIAPPSFDDLDLVSIGA